MPKGKDYRLSIIHLKVRPLTAGVPEKITFLCYEIATTTIKDQNTLNSSMKTQRTPLYCLALLSLIIFLAGSLSLQAQEVKTSLYLQKYRSAFIGFGPRFLNTDPGTITTTFVDDSPSMDSFNSTFDVKDGYTHLGVNFGYKFGRYRGLSHDIVFDIAATTNYTFKFGYSLGWNFLFDLGDKNLLIRPALQGLVANTVFQIGQLENNASYIQVDDLQYFESELDVELRSASVTLAPRLDVTYVLAKRFDVFLKLAYDLSRDNTDPSLELSVPEDLRTDDSPQDSSLDIDGDNPLVLYNGEKLESLPYNPSGLRLSIGVSYLWNR